MAPALKPLRAAPRVNNCTTPPMASVPYREERGPLTISMRSMDSGAMFCNAAPPMVPGLMRTPSTSTTVWLLSVPRVNSVVV